MNYEVDILPSAQKELGKLPKKIQKQIDEKILALSIAPRPSGAKKLKSEKPLWRIRNGDYRIVYSVDDEKNYVVVAEIGDRKKVYRGIR